MSLTVTAYDSAHAAAWDELVDRSANGTFLHSRRFLEYHGDRFADVSAMLWAGQKLVGVFPAAEDPSDPRTVRSHPGITFGGLVHDGSLTGPASLDACERLVGHYAGYKRLRYAAVPHIYHRVPAGDDLYAMFRLGARRWRCDLACAVDLATGPALSSRRRRGVRRAVRDGVEVAEGPGALAELWPVIEENLAARHSAAPVHTLAEMQTLAERFPDAVHAVIARIGDAAVGGAVLFDTPRVSHAQYIASNPAGNAAGALDAVFQHCLQRAATAGARFFDFGTSNRDDGRTLNAGLYAFKAEFGGGGVAYEHYELELSAATPNPVSP